MTDQITGAPDGSQVDRNAALPAQAAAALPPPAVAAAATTATKVGRPAFLDAVSCAYNDKGKGVVVLTGDTHDLFFCAKAGGGRFLELEESIFREWKDAFTVIRLDIATGIGFYDDDDLPLLAKVVALADNATLEAEDKMGSLKANIRATRHEPLPALVVWRDMLEAVKTIRRSKPEVKPVLTVIPLAGSLFPIGDFDRLGELDRQRLVTFLNMIEGQSFKNSPHLVVLIADTRSEINQRILGLPSVDTVEIELPTASVRRKFVDSYVGDKGGSISFEKGTDDFIEATAGLQLTSMRELLEVGRRSGQMISRHAVNEEINDALRADLGDVITVSRPIHGPADIVGYEETGRLIMSVMKKCDNPAKAVPAILISGSNGGGKTFQMEAYAAASGRVVIELTGLRGMYFGQTDAIFEKLRLRIKTYGKVLILVDEAHTAFGSVHKPDTHETEKRLAGNIIKMMGDLTLFGKVLWGLMTSRPDELDPDVKSRAPIQIPIFDLEGDERKLFIKKLFAREKIEMSDDELEEVLKITAEYSNRDFSFLVKEVLGEDEPSVLKTLAHWQASKSILRQRKLQRMIAAQHCTYPILLPADLKDRVGTEEFEQELQRLTLSLHY